MRIIYSIQSTVLVIALLICSAGITDAAIWSTPGRSSDWNASTNWTPEVIPQNIDVIIDGETNNNSIVSLNTNATVNNVTISEGDSLTVNVNPFVLTIDGTTSPVVVDNQGSIILDGNVAFGKGLYIEGSVTWTNNGLYAGGNQNYTQFKVQSGATLTVCEGTTFSFYNQTWVNGTVTNFGVFQIGGLFFGGGGTQYNSGTMRFSQRTGANVINYIGENQGDLTLENIVQEQEISVEGGVIHLGAYNMHRNGYGNTTSLTGSNTTDLLAGKTLLMIRASTFNISGEGNYDFDGLFNMDAISASTASARYNTDCKLIAKNGTVNMTGDGQLIMTAGILGDYLKYPIITGDASTNAIMNNIAGGISGSGKICDNAISFINNSLVNATDVTYPIIIDPVVTGSFSNAPAGIIRTTGTAGVLCQDGSFINAGTLDILPDSQAVFTNSLVLNNDEGTLAFTIGATTNQAPVLKVFGDITLSGTLAVDISAIYDDDGNDAERYDIITCSGGSITDNGITLTNMDPDVLFSISDNGTIDGTFTIKKMSGGTLFIIK